jgi:hypothetical protein
LGKTDVNSFTVLSGALGVADLQITKMEILHKAAASLAIQGFKVKRIKVFENPLTAHVELENTRPCESVLATFVTSANKAFKHIEQKFLVILTLVDFSRSNSGTEMTYSIKRLRTNRHKYDDETSIELANKMQAKLISNVENTGRKSFTTIPAI